MNYENLDETLKKEFENSSDELAKSNKHNRRSNLAVLAILLAALIAITSVLLKGKKKKESNSKNETKIVNDVSSTIGSLGMELEFPTMDDAKKEYGTTTGNVDKTKLVEENNTIWINETAKDNSKNIGKVVIDTKNGSLEIKSNGTVYEKDIDYVIKDDKGNTIDSGIISDNGIPDGYAWDNNLGEYVKKEEVGLYIYCDEDYYDLNGELIFSKGDKVSIDTFNRMKKDLVTEKRNEDPTVKVETEILPVDKESNEVTKDNGVINPDGTYTIYGITYESKADYQAFVMGEEGYILIGDRVIYNNVEKEKTLIK